MKHIALFLTLIFLTLFIISCDTGTTADSFDSPENVLLVKTNQKCGKFKNSFSVFVTDNATDGAVIKKIDGCDGKVDTEFKDDITNSNGISFGGFLSSMAWFETPQED